MREAKPAMAMPGEEQAAVAAETFRLLADPTRIKLLWALFQGEAAVSELAELAEVSPTSVSQHLAKLRLAGLVRGRRAGTYIYYRAADTHVLALLTEALSHVEHIEADLGEESEHEHPLKHRP
ncbi:ArsR/SmtB family transcription factor [Gephyromycinifex aptenodytis]|uniref:ArsR/SmtB family transcription factor n=1 Tax=Gephyromycinifex aptenodytis TaxID=2716227 RepID=UPI001445BAF3|nr:metalloregulator ArsR/SmtB family transcription factor [Gephyromycinifex aptenodytis]